MNISDYNYIVTIAREGSFTGAARALYIAQPSLSQRVRSIENEYGVTLFERGHGGIVLTPAGETFVRYAGEILAADENLRQELEELQKKDHSQFRLGGAISVVNSTMFDALIMDLHQSHPDLRLQIVQASSRDQQEFLLSGKTDLSVLYLPVTSPGLEYKVIHHDHYVLVPAEGSALRRELDAREDPLAPVDPLILDDLPLALTMPDSNQCAYINSLEQKCGIRINVQTHTSSYSVLYSMASGGVASVILPESYVRNRPYSLTSYRIDDPDSEILIAAAWKRKRRIPAYILEAIERAIGVLSEGGARL